MLKQPLNCGQSRYEREVGHRARVPQVAGAFSGQLLTPSLRTGRVKHKRNGACTADTLMV